MALFRSEYQIGRGEAPESRLEAPFFAFFMIVSAFGLLIFHLVFQNENWTIAMSISAVIFAITLVRVDFGVYFLVVAMLLSPEIGAGAVGRGQRELNVRYDDVLIIVVFLGVLVKQGFEGRQSFWRPSPVNAGIAAYYGVCVFSTLLAWRASLPAWDKRVALFVMLKMAEFYMVFFLVGNAIRDLRQVRRQLGLFFIVAMIVSAYGLMTMGTEERIGAPFERGGTEPNTLGGYLTLVVCIATGLLINAPTRGKRLLCMLVIASAFVPFLFTLSRASYIALLVALVTLSIVGRRIIIFVSVVAILVLSPVLMPPDVQDRVNYTFQRGSGVPLVLGGWDTGRQVDKSTYERIYVWRKVRHTLRVWPLRGGGVAWGTVLDSQYARVLIETGLLGLAAFLFLQYRLLRSLRQSYRWTEDWFGRGLGMGAFAATIGLIAHSLGTITFLIVRIMEPYWFIVALAMVVRSVAMEKHFQRVSAQRQAQNDHQRTVRPVLSPPQPSRP